MHCIINVAVVKRFVVDSVVNLTVTNCPIITLKYFDVQRTAKHRSEPVTS